MSTTELMARVEALSLELDAAPSGPVVDAARDLCAVLLQIHRQAFEALLARPGDPAALSENDAVRAALALHGLEPAPAEVLVPAERLTARLRDQALADDRCERCGASLSSEHDHALAGDGALICVCAPCALAGGALRIREKIERASGVSLDDAAWSALDIPVGLAFFVRRRDGTFVARYPGPHGLCETDVTERAWRMLAGAGNELEPEVEALLVHRRGGAHAAYRVSIDRCHALAGLIRKTWRGLGGGAEADRAIASFFATLERREVAHA